MRFHIDHDEPGHVAGWVLPPNPSASAVLRVTVDGTRDVLVPADGFDPNILGNGWHDTGRCRFGFGGDRVPGMAEARTLRVHEADSNLLIYARDAGGTPPPVRMFLLTPGIRGGAGLDAHLARSFPYAYGRIHNMPEEALDAVLGAVHIRSVLLSGAIQFARDESRLERAGFVSAVLVPDPFVELAERILHLRGLAASRPAWRHGALADAARRFAGIDVARTSDLKAALRFADAPTWRFLSNPLTHLLGVDLADDHVRPPHSINAIEVLSRMGVVGHEAWRAEFVRAVMEAAGGVGDPPVLAEASEEARELAGRLARIKTAREAIAFDLAIGRMVEDVCRGAWGGKPRETA